jgi:hypothetical protein
MPLPLGITLVVVFTIGGAVILGPIGIIGGAGAALLLWAHSADFVEGLREDLERRDQEDMARPHGDEERFTPLRAVILAALTLLMLYVVIGMAVDRAG